ncbi:hypothetical protein [Actinopolymorpha pittospori]|uniref:Lipoprotein n=1 Tax=Actinopolymorpha pittospori TaxID=648752 RepID=A0A927N062_9ACTN|nr:hypothetical protein [Actinopolymorpha pittospori]MBE1606522.1 hypothetical protein [Actinopolymorpha pittospori]
MSRVRYTHIAMGLVLTAFPAAFGCGADRSVAAPDRTGLDVLFESAVVRGMDGVAATPLPAGTLRPGEMLTSLVRLEADEVVSTRGLVQFEGRATRVNGGAELGVTGMCGQGWTVDGEQIDADPCSAVSPVTAIGAGQDSTVQVRLYPSTEAGQVTPGTYRVSIPLDEPDGPLLDLTYRIVEAGQAHLPP